MALLLLSVVVIACQDEYETGMPNVPDGYVALRFRTNIPAMQEVTTRAVDEDGKGVQNMTLFCFDTYGLFVTTVTAKVTPESETTGAVDASVPDHTRIIHFVANQNMSEFPEDSFLGKSEAEVMALLQGSSGRMIYWARFACDPNNTDKIDRQMSDSGNAISLIRNHAQVSVANPTGNGYLEVTGFKVYNTNAFGTVAPYHPQNGFNFTWPSNDSPFITLPDNKAKMSDIQDVVTDMSQYVFECENKDDDPVSVIIKGHLPGQSEELYYRIMLVDENGEQLLIRRNHHYMVNIVGTLSYGQPTFEEALEASATNNVWISISEDVKEVEDQAYILAVEQTTYILDPNMAPGTGYQLHYTVKSKSAQAVADTDKPTISWIEGNTVASESNIKNDFTVNASGTGEGTITIYTYPLGENIHKLEGTLLIKKGRLQRKIKIIKMQEQTFIPSWMGAQLYGRINESDESTIRPKATAMFTIPETCPQELFPMRVLLSVNALDVRAASGMTLSIIRKGDEGYGADNDWGYKYVYMAESAGVQRVYFESILNQVEEDAKTPKKLIIEAEHFKTMELEFMFSEKTNTITLEGLESYNAAGMGGPQDEAILYRLVPQKQGAMVQFDMQMKELDDKYQAGSPVNATEHDEFLIYTSNLTHYDRPKDAGLTAFDCVFHHTEATEWWKTNNPNGGQACMFTPVHPTSPTAGTGRYAIYMYTNKAKSAEVVRIASNLNTKPAVLADNAEGGAAGGLYIGETYRSVIFELANYHPFRFAARVNYDGSGSRGDDATGNAAEPVTPLTWSYNPGKTADIEIDITSFAGSDDKSADPFGRTFEVYIDAPMLEIDESRLAECHLNKEKLKAHPEIAGRFVYTVEADRERERPYGIGPALSTDNTAGTNQEGERKRLPFKVKNVVSAGDIVISSDETEVVFFGKTFRVGNQSITGTLKYRTSDGNEQNVPHNSFVPFERTSNNSRIGAITVTADGQYELRLRKEYPFNWNTDKVELRFENPADKIIYSATVENLATLFANPNIVLEPEPARGN